MSRLLDTAKEKGIKVDYRFSFWESYYNNGFTPSKAIEEESKKRAIQEKIRSFG
jgi:hypothetical protein